MGDRQSLPLPDADKQVGADGCRWTHRLGSVKRKPLPGGAAEDWERDWREVPEGSPHLRWRISREYRDGRNARYLLRLWRVDETDTVLEVDHLEAQDYNSLQDAQEAAAKIEAAPESPQREPLGFVAC